MIVRFERPFFIEGHHFPARQAVLVPDRFRDRLPSGANILSEEPASDPGADPKSRPADPDMAATLIRKAAGQIDQSNPDHFTARGDIKTQALFDILGWEPTRSEVNAALAGEPV